MAGISTSDKSLFQARRVIVQRSEDASPEKKKFHLGRVLPFKNFSVKTSLTKEIFFANKKRGIITVVVLIMVIGAGAYGYYQYLLSQNPAVIYAKKLKSITDIARQQTKLPTNEQPVIATVTDVTKLPKEAFFKNAQDGDKILLYKKDKEAILYRPSMGQVITIATLNFENITPTPASAGSGQVVPIKGTVAGASTSTSAIIIGITPGASSSAEYVPQGKILVRPR